MYFLTTGQFDEEFPISLKMMFFPLRESNFWISIFLPQQRVCLLLWCLNPFLPYSPQVYPKPSCASSQSAQVWPIWIDNEATLAAGAWGLLGGEQRVVVRGQGWVAGFKCPTQASLCAVCEMWASQWPALLHSLCKETGRRLEDPLCSPLLMRTRHLRG